MAITAAESPRNRIPGWLPPDEYARVVPHLERVDPELKHVLFDVDRGSLSPSEVTRFRHRHDT